MSVCRLGRRLRFPVNTMTAVRNYTRSNREMATRRCVPYTMLSCALSRTALLAIPHHHVIDMLICCLRGLAGSHVNRYLTRLGEHD